LHRNSEVISHVSPIRGGLEISHRISLVGAVVPLKDSVIGNNDDLIPAFAEGLIIIFLLRGRLIVLLILLVSLVWAFPRIVCVKLDATLVSILIFIVAGLVVAAIPITSIVVGIIPAA